MTEVCKTNEGSLGKLARHETKDKSKEPKTPSPAKSAVSDDTRDSAASETPKSSYGKTEFVLPAEITSKDYSAFGAKEAEEQLWKDLKDFDPDFAEKEFVKYLFLDENGKAYVSMPTEFHEGVIDVLIGIIKEKSTSAERIHSSANGSIGLEESETQKYPDIYVFGPDRVEVKHCLTSKFRYAVDGGKLGKMNPHAVIEVSWSNGIAAELKKLAMQINHHDRDFGRINVGYLIKFIPLKKGALPTKKDRKKPLWGLDIYRMESTADGSEALCPDEGHTWYSWRHGQDFEGKEIEFTIDELGTTSNVSIPVEWIVDTVKDFGVIFQSPPNDK